MSAIATDALAAHPVMSRDILRGFHLLEADAGTGKTWTIAGLVVRALVESSLTIDRILVVTFTNAAKDELGARIRERIAQLATLLEDRIAGRESRIDEAFCTAYAPGIVDPDAALSALRVALAQIDQAAIQTIHSFCHRVIAEHTLSIGVRLDGDAGDQGDAWIERGVADWWSAVVEGADAPALELLRAGRVTPAGVVELLSRLDGIPGARVLPRAEDWRAIASAWGALRVRLGAALARESSALYAWISVKGQADGKRFQRRYVDGWLASLRAFCDGDLSGGAIPNAVTRLNSEWFRGGKGTFMPPPLDLVAACDALEQLAPVIGDLGAQVAIDAWSAVEPRRQELKGDLGGVDHDDLLRVVADALAAEHSGEVLAALLRDRFPLALIDECQDTDALQWDIFRRIHTPGEDMSGSCLILVGDPKQAIYAFRNADVYTYLQARSAGPGRHALDENQRSSRALIESVNALFGRENAFLVPEIGFGRSGEGRKRRRSFSVADRPGRAAMTVMLLQGTDDARMLDRAEASRQSVGAVAQEIGQLLAPGVAALGDRPLQPADIAVLVNSHREGSLVKQALAAAGIGAVEISRDSVFESRECAELIRLVAAVADPADSGLVRSALVTTMAGFDARGLVDPTQEAARAAFVEALVAARDGWPVAGPQAALRRLLLVLGAPPRLAALRDGDRRMTNLLHLLELLAGNPEPREGAHAALRWLGRMRADPAALGSEAVELRLESDDDLVRIVTVHKSKGLEFPVVFLPFAWSGRAMKPGVMLGYHEPLDDGWIGVADLRRDPGEEVREHAAREAHAERLRSLYVALTRAEHRCYVCWGAGQGAQFAPLAWLLCGLDPSLQQVWRIDSKEPPALTHDLARSGAMQWRERAGALHADAVEVVGIERSAAAADSCAATPGAGGDESAPLFTRDFAVTIPAPWIQTSFSRLSSMLQFGEDMPTSGRAAGDRPDHDQAVATRQPTADAGDSDPRDIRQTFPGGAQAGVCLHGILEHTDFGSGVQRAIVSEWLERSGYDDVDADAVTVWLDEILAATLPDLGGGAIRLSTVPGAATVRELEFQMSASGVDNAALVAAVSAEYPLDAQVAHSRWSGFLTGFVDLVVESAGRYYVVDWKSNRLAADASGYTTQVMADAIGASAYALQFCLYCLALHRFLARRVPDYDYERHFGGVHYVFLRGAGGAADRERPGSGVYATRPSLRLIETLDRMFGGRE